nr:hypothetical protein [uncultured Sphingomonas sp.]
MNALAAERLDYATEQLYALLPAHIRSVDAQNGWALKALVRVLAGGSAEIDGEIERLYAAQFIETASEELLAEFAALVGAEALRPLPEGARQNERAYIANTLRYRRGKGTARVLEQLAADVGGFGACVVEYFQRLARLQHLIDPRLERPGLAKLTPGQTSALAGTSQDRLARLAEFRAMPAGGRHGINNVGVHLLRLRVPFFPRPQPSDTIVAAQLDSVPIARPMESGSSPIPGHFQLSAQRGRPLRLFNPDRRSQQTQERALAVHLPDRLRRLPLHEETSELRIARAEGRDPRLADERWFDREEQPFAIYERKTASTTFSRIPPEQIRICSLEKAPQSPFTRLEGTMVHNWGWDSSKSPPRPRKADMPIRCGFDPVTGRLIMAAPKGSEADVEEVRVAYGTGIALPIGAGPQDRAAAGIPLDVSDQPNDVPFVWVVDAKAASTSGSASDTYAIVPTLRDALDAWEATAQPSGAVPHLRGIIVLVRCDRFASPQLTIKVHAGSSLEIVSGIWMKPAEGPDAPQVKERRGFILRRERRFTIDAKTTVVPNAVIGRKQPGALIVDGVEFTRGIELGDGALSRLSLRHCTLRRPGGDALGATAPPYDFQFDADHCIIGRIAPPSDPKSAGCKLQLSNCIVSCDEASGAACEMSEFDGALQNVTFIGSVTLRTIEATNVIFNGRVTSIRTQVGCLRYSFVAPKDELPRRFRCQPEQALAVAAERKGGKLDPDEIALVTLATQPRFLDTSLDEPAVAMLHPRCDAAIRSGGERDVEMGAFALSATALRLENISRFFDDYLPFGLVAATIDDTRSSTVVAARNKP